MSRTMIWTVPPSVVVDERAGDLHVRDSSVQPDDFLLDWRDGLAGQQAFEAMSRTSAWLSDRKISKSDLPTTCSGEDAPNRRTAAGFRNTMRLSSLMRMPSGDSSTRRRIAPSVSRIAGV